MSLLDKVINFATPEQAFPLLTTLNENQLNQLDGEIYGHKYWFEQKASFIDTTEKAIEVISGISVKIKSILKSGNYLREMNENGLIVERYHSGLDCHNYARLYLNQGFETLLCVDFCYQYFINRETRKITYYCEGDVVTLTANSDEQLDLEVESIQQWYRDNY